MEKKINFQLKLKLCKAAAVRHQQQRKNDEERREEEKNHFNLGTHTAITKQFMRLCCSKESRKNYESHFSLVS
jgi:hypothetical protein